MNSRTLLDLSVVMSQNVGDSTVAEPVVQMFERIASEEGWQPGDELRAHLRRSVFFALCNAGEKDCNCVVGGLQLVLPGDDGDLPCHQVWQDLRSTSSASVAHVAVMAVDVSWRGGKDAVAPFWLLAVEMWRYCAENGITEVWLEATPRVLKLYQRLGFPLTVVGDLREHWGEPCYLASMRVREVAGAMAEKAVRSEIYREILARAFRFLDLK